MGDAVNDRTKDVGSVTVRLCKDRLEDTYGMRCLGIAAQTLLEGSPKGVMMVGEAVNGGSNNIGSATVRLGKDRLEDR